MQVLAAASMIMNTETLSIPHPRAAERAFVLMPLQDIAAEFVDPVQKKTIHELVKELPEEEKKKVTQLCKRGWKIQEYKKRNVLGNPHKLISS